MWLPALSNPRAQRIYKKRKRVQDLPPNLYDEEVDEVVDRKEDQFFVAFYVYVAAMRGALAQADAQGYIAAGAADKVAEAVTSGTTEAAFERLTAIIEGASNEGASRALAALPPDFAAKMRSDDLNPFIAEHLDKQTANLVTNINEDVRQQIRDIVRQAFSENASVATIADRLQAIVGLNSVQAKAYQRFAGNAAAKAQYLQKLLEQRAMTIARTEIAMAFHAGQLGTWKYAAELNMLPEGAVKVWLTDKDPCVERCASMNGQERPLNKPFVTAMGELLQTVPAHARCRCQCTLYIPDNKGA